MIRVFLDANVLVAGSASETGGSALLLEWCGTGKVDSVVSRLVLLEAERNTRQKLPPKALERFRRFLKRIPFRIAAPVSRGQMRPYRMLIHEKDAPVLTAALCSGAEHLITLDRCHFMTERIRRAHLPIRILTPREFLADFSGRAE